MSKYTNHGVNKVRILANDDCGANLKKNYTKMQMAQSKFISSYHSSFSCDDVKGGFDEEKEIGDHICGMKMLKKEM